MARTPRRPSYAELVALVERLEAQVRDLTAENARLRAAAEPDTGPPPAPPVGGAAGPVPPGGRKRPPGWVKANVVVVARHRPRRPRAPVAGRRRAVPDRILVHAPAVCLGCGQRLERGRLVGRRQVLDLPVVRAEVVEHQVRERRCRSCGWVGRGVLPDLRDQVGEHRRVGWQVAATVATLRTKLRLPVASLQWLLERLWGLRLSVGELSGLLADTAAAGKGAYTALLAEARASPVIHIDETGWRENGRNGYVWTVSTPTVRLFHYVQSRAGAVADRLLGEDGTGTVVSDFYGAYDHLNRSQQRCWAHLLRDLQALRDTHPTDHGLHRWAAAVTKVYARAVAWAARATADQTRPLCRERVRDRFEAALVDLCRGQPATAPQAVLCARIVRYRTDLFTFVADPAVPPTNNAAERALRPLVIARKISGGTRSKQGSRTRMVLQSLVATWDLRGLDPIAEFLTLLRATHVTPASIAPV